MWIVAAAWALVNAGSTLKGEVLPVEWQAKVPRVLDILGTMPWWGWALCWAGLLLGLVFEGAYRMISRLQIEVDDLKVSTLPEIALTYERILEDSHRGMAMLLPGSLPGGVYFTAVNVRLTNRSSRRTVLTVSLCVTLGDGRKFSIEPENLPLSDPNPHWLPANLSARLSERRLPNPVNLDPQSGDTGHIFFLSRRIPREQFHGCLLEWEVEDSMSGRRSRFPAAW